MYLKGTNLYMNLRCDERTACTTMLIKRMKPGIIFPGRGENVDKFRMIRHVQ